MFPDSSNAPNPRAGAPGPGTSPRTSPIVGAGSTRLSRTADVVLARLIADEASFARRVHRTREPGTGHRVARAPASFLGAADADPEYLA